MHRLPTETHQNILKYIPAQDRANIAKASDKLKSQVMEFNRHAAAQSMFRKLPVELDTNIIGYMTPATRWKFGRTSIASQNHLRDFYWHQELKWFKDTTKRWDYKKVAFVRNIVDMMEAVFQKDAHAWKALKNNRLDDMEIANALKSAHKHYKGLSAEFDEDEFVRDSLILLERIAPSKDPKVHELFWRLTGILKEMDLEDELFHDAEFDHYLSNIHKEKFLHDPDNYYSIPVQQQMQLTINHSLGRKNYKIAEQALKRSNWTTTEYDDEEGANIFDQYWDNLSWPRNKRHYPKQIRELIRSRGRPKRQTQITEYYYPK